MNQWINESVGKDAFNDPSDVEVVEELLHRVGAYSPMLAACESNSPMTEGSDLMCLANVSDDFIQAIEDFQNLWGRVDGRVDPRGATLRRLNYVAEGPKLNSIDLDRITRGGYRISYKGEILPSPYRMLLGISRTENAFPVGSEMSDFAKVCIDLTGRKSNDLIGPDNLPHLLEIFGRWSAWGTEMRCKIIVIRIGRVISTSNSVLIKCPVKPYSGPLRPELGAGDGGPKLNYTGIQTGRMFHHKKLAEKYFFKYGGLFETNNNMRGFNCITYVGAVFGVNSASGAMSYRGEELAKYLNATKCNMEKKKSKDIKEFFDKNKKGTYIMWSLDHVVLVVNNIIHEFSRSKGGYATTNTKDWGYGIKFYTVRKLNKTF